MRTKRKSPQSKPMPLQTLNPGEEEAPSKRQLQMITASPFKLPDGWSVEEKPRPLTNNTSPGQIDKYYHELATGLKFRSLAAVQRYLTEGKIDSRARKVKPDSESNMQLTPYTNRSSPPFVLPDDWEIEEKPRSNVKYAHVVDKTYIEPGTGQRFRSLKAVERYLRGAYEVTPLKVSPGSSPPKMKSPDEILSQEVIPSPQKTNISGENDRPHSKLNFGIPPEKVNWVLASPGGNMWNAMMDDSKVPDSVKKKWSETFMSSISGAWWRQ